MILYYTITAYPVTIGDEGACIACKRGGGRNSEYDSLLRSSVCM